jgi:hypothetical protein
VINNLPRYNQFRHHFFNPSFLVNKNQHPCYLGAFAQANHSRHANAMLYLFGQHVTLTRDFTINDILMDKFYPQMIRNFVRGQKPSDSEFYG